MANRTDSQAFIEAEIYSQFILTNLPDGLLPDVFTRDVSDFGSGTTLNIKQVGAAIVQDVTEGVEIAPQTISTNTVTLNITDYTGNAWFVTDELRQDGSQIDALIANYGIEATYALQLDFETKFLEVCNAGLTAGNANVINGQAHRKIASGSGNVLTLDDIISMKLAFDKAKIPQSGRIAIVDPVVEATLNKLVVVTATNTQTPSLQSVINTGFAENHKFVCNLFGFEFYTSNQTASVLSETIGLNTISDAKACVFMSVANDNVKPIMKAWRKAPSVEGWREQALRRDRFQLTSRFGFGVQRKDGLGVILASASNY